MDNKILEGMKIALGILLVFGVIFGLVYASGFHYADEVLSGTFLGNYIYSGNVSFNSNVDLGNANVSGLSIPDSVPVGAIMSFYLSFCPSGWIAADGTNGTPDLRGQFVRGLNDFGTGVRSDGNQDPDGLGRVLGDWQVDAFKSHTHGMSLNTQTGAYGTYFRTVHAVPNVDVRTTTDGNNGLETRPKNVALIYCMKQ